MMGSMSRLTCSACGYRFETVAKSNRTRCGQCRSVVKVPLDVRRANGYVSGRRRASEPVAVVLVLQFACGHVDAFFDEGIRPSEVRNYLWACEECGADDQESNRLLGSLSEDEVEGLDEEDVGAWFASLFSQAAVT
jgi:DNA-directed RNA polymerase subunit RPC12/RpoP